MQGSIAQSIGLTLAGNALLQGRDIGPFWPDSPVFVFCRSVRFVEAASGRRAAKKIVAPDPMSWFRSLAKECMGLRLHVVSRQRAEIADWVDVALVGGGSVWLIETVGCPKPLLWSDQWTFSDGPAARERPWSVTYRGNQPTALLPDVPTDLDAVEQDLAATLTRIAAFADRIDSHFVSFFREALSILERRVPPDRSFTSSLGPPGFLSPQAERILGACQAAWVFGGMGAWNDGAYSGGEGDRLTDALFGGLQTAVAASASSTCAAFGS
ncbi:MAG TPA: hypothetical protein VF619_09940 [Allosphingosinicella sp.]|jgi:hypothetical protein